MGTRVNEYYHASARHGVAHISTDKPAGGGVVTFPLDRVVSFATYWVDITGMSPTPRPPVEECAIQLEHHTQPLFVRFYDDDNDDEMGNLVRLLTDHMQGEST